MYRWVSSRGDCMRLADSPGRTTGDVTTGPASHTGAPPAGGRVGEPCLSSLPSMLANSLRLWEEKGVFSWFNSNTTVRDGSGFAVACGAYLQVVLPSGGSDAKQCTSRTEPERVERGFTSLC